jgi:hypothetical protein
VGGCRRAVAITPGSASEIHGLPMACRLTY